MTPYSLYLHIPFCRYRCGYCDFNTYAGLDNLIPDYVSALCREAELLASSADSRLPVHTVYLGGGTPSLLSLDELERIFSTLSSAFGLLPGLETSLEANPGTLSLPYLRGLRAVGVNRLSLGMQSANPSELAILERQHGFGDVTQAVEWARQAGFDNLNLDLIFGLPGQALGDWERSLTLALGLQPEHLSLYALTLEHGTPMQHWVMRGLLPDPDPDLAADMYELASDRLVVAGYEQYEISNWAREPIAHRLSRIADSGSPIAEDILPIDNPAYACRHNLQYWRNQPYLGLGAGAHGYAAKLRIANINHPASYTHCLSDHPPTDRAPRNTHHAPPNMFPVTPATSHITEIGPTTEIGETMMMGLRLTREGVPDARFRERFGVSLRQVFSSQIERLQGLGLLEWVEAGEEVLRLTAPGRLLGNVVFREFV